MGFFDTTEDAYIYYNMEAGNKNATSPQLLRYIDNRGMPILNNASDYEMSILRFGLDTSEIPLIIFPNNVSEAFNLTLSYESSTVDNAFYSITLDDGAGNVNQQFLIYESYGKQSPYIYDFSHFVNILNKAVRASATALGIFAVTPYFTYNKSAGCIDFTAPNTYNASIPGHYKIYVNKNLFDAFCSSYCGNIVDGLNGRYYNIIVEGRGDNTVTNLAVVGANGTVINTGTITGFRMEPYYPNLSRLIAIDSIIFTSNNIPTLPEYINTNNDMNSDTNYTSSKIIKDFQLSTEGIGAIQVRGQQHFKISGENEMIVLKSGGSGIKTIDIEGYWKDRYGKLSPLYLPVGTSASMKILFKRR